MQSVQNADGQQGRDNCEADLEVEVGNAEVGIGCCKVRVGRWRCGVIAVARGGTSGGPVAAASSISSSTPGAPMSSPSSSPAVKPRLREI